MTLTTIQVGNARDPEGLKSGELLWPPTVLPPASANLQFKEFNIIYGWNYSGKTTLSRIFRSIEQGYLPDGYHEGKFELETDFGSITEQDLNSKKLPEVAVFNADFIDENLAWDGKEFNAILLLGQESIQIQKQIDAKIALTNKLRAKQRKCQRSLQSKGNTQGSNQTELAKTIKYELGLIESFDARHTKRLISQHKDIQNSVLLTDEEVQELRKQLKQENRTKKLKPRSLTSVALPSGLIKKGQSILQEIPHLQTVIEALKDNPALSRWIETGLSLHANVENCQYCGAKLDTAQQENLRSHFSKDFEKFRQKITAVILELEDFRKQLPDPNNLPDFGSFYEELQTDAQEITKEVKASTETITLSVDLFKSSLKEKINSVFQAIHLQEDFNIDPKCVNQSVQSFNNLIDRHESISRSLEPHDKGAIRDKLKEHFTVELLTSPTWKRNESDLSKLTRIQKLRDEKIDIVEKEIALLDSKINKAVKGAEHLTQHIRNFLGHEELRIEASRIGDRDRFRLMRGPNPAMKLSEGEKTAVAFAFFLCKLEEKTTPSDCIVYIDDPISSLDSNHIFQIYSVLREQFFHKKPESESAEKWTTKHKQLFVSTHNLDFFGLLQEIPMQKKKDPPRFFAKRLSAKAVTLSVLPRALSSARSEYVYLFSYLADWRESEDKSDFSRLLHIPNAFRRFLELYTFSRLPGSDTLDTRIAKIFGEKGHTETLKVLHYFSHSASIERMHRHSELLSCIEPATDELFYMLKADSTHFQALQNARDEQKKHAQ